MDEFLDLADALDFLTGSMDADILSDHGIDALTQVLDGADYTSFSGDLIDAVGAMDPDTAGFWTDHASNLFDAHTFDVSDLGSITDFANATDVTALATQLTDAVDSVPTGFRQGLAGINWVSDVVAANPDLMGYWAPHAVDGLGSVASIQLFDHAAEAVPTLFHEIGHHIASLFPDFFGEFQLAAAHAPDLWSDMGFLANYDPSQIPGEAFAEAISYYNTQPEILQTLAPETFDVIDRWWTTVGSATA